MEKREFFGGKYLEILSAGSFLASPVAHLSPPNQNLASLEASSITFI
jgi:hypothetical protein